jgi:cell division protein FtsI (penicillin-binding protein 3)
MPRRHPDEKPSVAPSRSPAPSTRDSSEGTDGRTPTPRGSSRITEARSYHPRARTVGDSSRTDLGRAARPPLRLVTDESDADREALDGAGSGPNTSRTASARAANARAASRNTSSRTAANSRTQRKTAKNGRTATAGRAAPVRRRESIREPDPPKLADQGARLRLGTVIIMVVFLVLAGRLIQFQLSDAPAYAAQGLAARLQPVDLPAARGSILDRNGAVLAGSAEARYVYADPSRVVNPAQIADALSPLIGVPRSELMPKLSPHTRDDGSEVLFEYLARGVPVAIGEQVSALNLPGIGVRRDESRVVPGQDLAANLIGFTGRDLQGLAGLEASYNDLLRGVDGSRRYEIGQEEVNLDHEIPGGYHEETPARPGHSLQLTIDRDLQFVIQRILATTMAQAKAYTGAAVVLDVRTGEVLAQASYPSYDAADPFGSRPEDRGDVAATMAVDPGSVHKAIVFAACLQEGIVKPGDTVAVPSTITKGATTFTDTHWHPPMAPMTLPGILAWSSNVGTITLADRLGAQKLYEYQRAFGLGDRTGEGLPGESAGLVQPPANWSADSHGSIPIGMGVSVTPLQMAAVYAAIANGGVWVQPHLVKAIIDPDGTSTPTAAAPTRRVISAENATALRNMLEAVVVAEDATGLTAAIKDYRVAGKTGTGKVVKDGFYVNGEVGSFIGMAPADAPRYVIAVFAHTPGGNGGVVAGPAFAEMMEQALLHYRVAPTGTKPPAFAIYG